MAANPKATKVALVVLGDLVYVCYIDESGCTGVLPNASSPIQPVFALGALFLHQDRLVPLTHDLLRLKRRFFPNLLPAGSLYHDWMAVEIKGSELRRQARSASRNDRRFSYMVVGEAFKILENHGAKFIGRVYIKPIGGVFDGAAVYTATVQYICSVFQQYLSENQAKGIVIADSRNKHKNANVAHSIFTQRYRAGGDPYSRLIEVPTFGHSDNHAGLQVTDLLCSAILFPLAAQTCCSAHLTDHTHCSPHYDTLKTRFGQRLKALQYRYQDVNTAWWHGGLNLIDPLNHFQAPVLFA